jgi:hypothetical protein
MKRKTTKIITDYENGKIVKTTKTVVEEFCNDVVIGHNTIDLDQIYENSRKLSQQTNAINEILKEGGIT